MFVINQTGSEKPVILEVSKEKKTLAELGIGDQTDVVIFDSDIGPDCQTNKSSLYHIIGERFGI